MKSFGKWNIPKIELAWASTGTLFYQFIKKVCALDENRTMYCDQAGRVYIFKKKWIRKKRGMKLVCESWKLYILCSWNIFKIMRKRSRN